METFGMALAEAQACGTPVVAFDVGGVSDAVSDECAEYLVPNGDFESCECCRASDAKRSKGGLAVIVMGKRL